LKIKGDKFAPFIQDLKNIPCSMTQMLRLMTDDPKIAPKVSLIAILSFPFLSIRDRIKLNHGLFCFSQHSNIKVMCY